MTRAEEKNATKQRILSACIKLFIEQGYHSTTLSEIVKEAKVSFSSFQNLFHTKDGVLLALVEIMFANQFEMAKKIDESNLKPVFVYATETAIQLTLTELSENLREIYVEAYSNPEAAEYIFRHTANEIKRIFKAYNPECTDGDFYELEIGSAGIMRNYMARRCDQYFTFDRKLSKFLTLCLRVYNVPPQEIAETLEFVKSINIKEMSQGIMRELLKTFSVIFDFEINDDMSI